MNEPMIMSRVDAKAGSLKWYFTGKPCKYDHVAVRYTSSGVCIECQRKNNATYLPNYMATNHIKIKAYMNAYYRADRDRFIKRAVRWKSDNPEKTRVSNAASRKRHFETVLAKTRNYRALKRTGGKHTAADVRQIYDSQKGKCAYCRCDVGRGYHVDHIMPVKLGGRNDKSNLQITCVNCNVRKNARHPIEFAQSIGLLL